MLSAARSRSAYLNFLSNAAHWHGLGGHSLAVQSYQDRFDRGYAMGIQNTFFETAVAQDFPRELDEIQCPKPFDVGFRPDVVNHHLADDLEGRL